jgi:hypothetical protein
MGKITKTLINSKIDRKTELRSFPSADEKHQMQTLYLGLGKTSLQREILPDGKIGDTLIHTTEILSWMDSDSTVQEYTLHSDGKLVRSTYVYEADTRVNPLATVILLGKIAFGRKI